LVKRRRDAASERLMILRLDVFYDNIIDFLQSRCLLGYVRKLSAVTGLNYNVIYFEGRNNNL
jgi:hypothetical protein